MALTNSQYDEIMRSYQQRQFDRKDLIKQRTDTLYSKYPAFQRIHNEIAEISIQELKHHMDSSTATGTFDTSALHRKIDALKQKRLDLLEEFGYSRDYLNPPYVCADCKDTGYIGNKRCHCFEQAAIDLIYNQSNIADVLSKENFDTFDLRYYDAQAIIPEINMTAKDNALYVYKACKDFCDQFSQKRGNMMIYGSTGSGKTFMTHCITNELLKQGFSVIYFTAFELFDIFQKVTFQKDSEAKKEYDNIFSCDLLIIDDLGTEFSSAFTNSQLFLCLNERLLRGKSLVVSTNMTPGEIANNYSERVFSRISSDFMLIKLFCDDIRIQKKINNR